MLQLVCPLEVTSVEWGTISCRWIKCKLLWCHSFQIWHVFWLSTHCPISRVCYMLLASLRSHLSNPYIFFTIQSGKNLRLIFSYFFLIQDVIRLNFFSEPDGPVMGNGAFKSSILVPGYVVWMKYLYCFLRAVFLLYYIYQLKFFW